MRGVVVILSCCLILLWAGMVMAGQTTVVKGVISDFAGQPVAGAEIYVFKTANVKRPADFISPRTGLDGRFEVTIPRDHYWATAIFRLSGARFGPLLSGDKHSGEPVEFDATEPAMTLDFTVIDMREAARKNQKKNETLIKLTGRIVNEQKEPVAMAYVMADKRNRMSGLPQFFSAWTNEDGAFTLYLPHGKFFLGTAIGFPPDNDYLLEDEIFLEKDRSGMEIVLNKELLDKLKLKNSPKELVDDLSAQE